MIYFKRFLSVSFLKLMPTMMLLALSGCFFIRCSPSKTPVGDALYQATHNKLYKRLDQDSLAARLKTYINTNRKAFKNPTYLEAFYKEKSYSPVLLTSFYADSSLFHFLEYLKELPQHGLSPRAYHLEGLKEQLYTLGDGKAIQAEDDAYNAVIRAELSLANAFTNYCFSLKYGKVNPRKAVSNYYIKTERPDSLAFFKLLHIKDMQQYLDSIQPRDQRYQAMQRRLKENGLEEKERITLIANLERLRWKYEQDTSKMIYVNIPAYQLYVIRDGKVINEMKVVVGKADGHETPVLSSMIHSAQVNPIWNIPESIASKEILVQAQEDKYYLSNNGIDVYQHGKRLEDPDSINWSQYTKENLPYMFKQRPGESNSLGKIKFLFENGSSVYLHDTPAKAVFARDIRASSHGCVRVEEPLQLAHALFDDGEKYKTITKEMQSQDPKANTLSLTPQVQVVLDYKTCTLSEDGKLKYYSDVYQKDMELYKLLH